jgi:glutaredoxin/uncharacterized membrane protein YhaH (DUF805 family)
MEELSQLVFFGEILPDRDAEAVKARLAELLKLPAEQVGAVFSGRKVVLRKSLPTEQAAAYVARLEKIGVKVFAEPLPPPLAAVQVAPEAVPAPAATVVALEPAVPAAAVEPARSVAMQQAAAPAEEMNCPKCGEHQPRRTLCRSCSVDMKRYAEALQEAETAAREERMLAREMSMPGRHGRVAAGSEDETRLFGFGFEGRLGRRSYLIGCLLSWAIGGFAALAFFKLGSYPALFVGMAISFFISVRMLVLRCHDLNWSGWFWLLTLIPYIGAGFALLLLFIPGSRDGNNHGFPGAGPGFVPGLAVLAVCVMSTGMLYKSRDEIFAYYAGQLANSGGSSRGKDLEGPMLSVAEADVEMFTTSDCGVCHVAKAYMQQRGISYAEKDVEKNEDYLREFYARGGRGVPYIFVGSQSMMGFEANRLEQMLANRG